MWCLWAHTLKYFRYFISIRLTFIFLVLSEASVVPSFSWHRSAKSADGIPNLLINFPDGSQDKVVLKKMFPDLVSSRDTGDDCIYDGHLQHESGVYVTMTGGCPFEDSFEVNKSFLSFCFCLSVSLVKAVSSFPWLILWKMNSMSFLCLTDPIPKQPTD